MNTKTAEAYLRMLGYHPQDRGIYFCPHNFRRIMHVTYDDPRKTDFWVHSLITKDMEEVKRLARFLNDSSTA